MANNNHNDPDAERRNILARAQRTAELRSIFLKERSDPRRFAKMEDGFIVSKVLLFHLFTLLFQLLQDIICRYSIVKIRL